MIAHTRRILFVIVAAMLVLDCFAADNAGQLLQKCADKINSSPSLTLKFALSYGDKKSNCELIIARDKFRLSSADVEVWFDGTTQWSYSASESEVSITDPTPEEQLECNPFSIINNYKSVYSFRSLAGGKNEIELTAKSKMSSIRRAVLTIDPKTNLPSKMIVTMSNGRTFTATVTSAAVGKSLPSAVFTYDKAKYPARTTIDLR